MPDAEVILSCKTSKNLAFFASFSMLFFYNKDQCVFPVKYTTQLHGNIVIDKTVILTNCVVGRTRNY